MKSGEDKRVDKGENSPNAASNVAHNDVKHMAMGVMGLLKHDKKKAVQQVKHLIKLRREIAYNVLTSNVGGWTPVHACALKGSKKLLKTMLEAGISINITMGQPEGLPGGCTLLHVAANRADKKILDYLLHHGADVNARDSDGNTALYYAKQSNKDSVRLLISCGATSDDNYSNNHQHNHQKEHQQHHIGTNETVRQLHGSSPSLKHERKREITSEEKIKIQQLHIQPSQIHKENSHGNSLTAESVAEKVASPATSHFLTVPDTKFYSSSPCLHIQGPIPTSVSNDKAFTSSRSSISIVRALRNRSSKRTHNKHSNNNNNSVDIADLNSKKGLKNRSRSDYATSE